MWAPGSQETFVYVEAKELVLQSQQGSAAEKREVSGGSAGSLRGGFHSPAGRSGECRVRAFPGGVALLSGSHLPCAVSPPC